METGLPPGALCKVFTTLLVRGGEQEETDRDKERPVCQEGHVAPGESLPKSHAY